MDGLEAKTITTSRGYEYRYYTSTNTSASEAIFLLHGFRDSALCWKYMLPHLINLPYRLITPDLLGYAGSSKPTEVAAYAYHLMVQDMFDIADAENIRNIIPLGHDHGAGLAQRMYNHVPGRVKAVVLLSVAYHPPNKKEPYNLAEMNNVTKTMFGYPIAEYWNFLTAPDAARLMNTNLDRVFDIPHANTFEEMKGLYCVPNAMRQYLADTAVPRITLKPYARNESLKLGWRAEIENSGLEAPLCWYTAHVQQVQFESDKLVLDENLKIDVPVLFVGSDADAVCRPEMADVAEKAGLVKDLTKHTLKGVGHWPMYEAPKETAEFVVEFFREKVMASAA